MKNFRLALFFGLSLFACVPVRAASTEAEQKAHEQLNSTFVASGNNWLCAQKNGGSWILVELRNARISFSPTSIEETERLNGVTDRFTVYVTCDQFRERHGTWSEWTKGTPGIGGELVVAMTGGLLSYWSAHGEKKNGAWSIRSGLGGHPLSQDRIVLRNLIDHPDRAQPTMRSGVPALAETKAAAEAGDPEAQYAFANTFGAGGAEWKRWMGAAATQGYGAAEDDLAWTSNWVYFSSMLSSPTHVKNNLTAHGADMRRALLLASSAADKGFEHSRQLLAMAYENGVLLPRDPVEAYKWYRLIKDAERNPSNRSPNDGLVKIMSMDQVREGETRAARYQPGNTAVEIQTALIVPNLKLGGLASNGTQHIAIVNGTRLVAGQNASLNINGVSANVTCISVDEKSVVLTLAPAGTRVLLRSGSAPALLP